MPPEVQKSDNSVYPGPKEKGTSCPIHQTSALLRRTVMPTTETKTKINKSEETAEILGVLAFTYIHLNQLQPYILPSQSATRQTAPAFYSE